MPLSHRLSIAPMMDWSDRHCRYFWRLLTKQALLYTEMVTAGALIHGDRRRFLNFNPAEYPVALQLGGSDPAELARCALWAEEWGYAEINLNCGCPSDRVQSGMFGACLMAHPHLVANCVAAMTDSCAIPVTVKHRIGIDDMESYSQMLDFVHTVAAAGCGTFIVHARKAWLQGLSPRENREIPPLEYDWVYRLKREHPALEIVINGGITTLQECEEHLGRVDGVMLGRQAYQNPYMLVQVDNRLFGDTAVVASRENILLQLLPYVEQELSRGGRLNYISRHILGLFQNVPGARKFRRHLSENAYRRGAGIEVLLRGLALIREEGERVEAMAAGRTNTYDAEKTAR